MNYRTNDNLTASQVVSTILLCIIFVPLGLLHYYMCKRQNRKAMEIAKKKTAFFAGNEIGMARKALIEMHKSGMDWFDAQIRMDEVMMQRLMDDKIPHTSYDAVQQAVYSEIDRIWGRKY